MLETIKDVYMIKLLKHTVTFALTDIYLIFSRLNHIAAFHKICALYVYDFISIDGIHHQTNFDRV